MTKELGRLTEDVVAKEVSFNGETKKVVNNYLAVNRGKDSQGNNKTVFIKFSAWGKLAELMEKHCTKGMRVVLEGHLKNETFEYEGRRVQTLVLNVENIEFADTKKDENTESK